MTMFTKSELLEFPRKPLKLTADASAAIVRQHRRELVPAISTARFPILAQL